MNRRVTFLVLSVILVAMVLIFVQHLNSSKSPVTAEGENPDTVASGVDRNGRVNPLQRPQGGTDGPARIEPPIGSSLGPDGAPTPIRVTSGSDPRSVRPIDSHPDGPDAPPLVTEIPPSMLQPTELGSPSVNGTIASGIDSPTAVDQTPPLIAGGSANATQQSRPSASTGSPGLVPWDVPPQPRAAQPRTQAQPLSRQALTAQAQRGQQEQPRQSATDNTRALSEKGSHSLKNIALQITGDKIRVRIEADNAFPCKSFVLTNPDRLVVDLPGTWSNMKVPSVPRNEVVKNIRHGKQASGPRLVLDLNKTLKNHTVQRSGNVVEIVLQ